MLSARIATLKQSALAALYRTGEDHEAFVLKFRGWEVLDERATLKFQIDQVLKVYNDTLALEKRVSSRSIEEGYGRLDALNRIGNQVFSIDL